MMRELLIWFRRTILRRVTVKSCAQHGLYVGDHLLIGDSVSGRYDGRHVVTRVLCPFSFEAKKFRQGRSATMKYLAKMFAAFAASMFLVVKSGELAEDGKPVSACILGLFVFALFFYMAAVSVKAEREAGKR